MCDTIYVHMESDRSLSKFINILIHEGGSDLHLSAGSHPTVRVAGSLVSLTNEPILSGDDTLALLNSMITQEQRERFIASKELDFSYQLQDRTRFRCNAWVPC